MQIDRLRLVGFKSFADAAEVTIGPGLTGIVGPNGCGKSNLAEALRWVMGENSARRLRGGAMDDVIFGGTAARTARNLAEVALAIDNSGRDAPFAFNDREDIEIVRRIERGGGSTWRVNGREVRARDVQLLFADAATGVSSGAIVSQGRVSALIEAKPAERRFLLEEAAGTAGVQARRHETELKLAAAEENLTRLDDVVATMASQLGALQRQARQAQRYRRLGEQIRRQEALMFHARWLAAVAEAETRAAELSAAEQAAAAAENSAVAERGSRDGADAALSPLRRVESEASAELQRLTQSRTALEQELARSVAARRDTERRLSELERDREREDAQLAEAEAALMRLAEERQKLADAEAESGPARIAAEDRLHEIGVRLAAAEAALQCATETVAASQAQRSALDRRRREIAERRARLEPRLAEAERQRAALAATIVPPEAKEAAAVVLAEAEAEAERCRAAAEASQSETTARQQREAFAFDTSRRAAAGLARLEAEASALDAVVTPMADAHGGTPILAAVRVAEGFEAAIGALFGDELSASCGDRGDADRFWVDLPEIAAAPALPAGAHFFAEAVTAPLALGRSLAFAGWVDSDADGRNLQPHLAPGQQLVDRDGRLWRWDGYTRLAASASAAAQQLRHKNRLDVLAGEIAAAAAQARTAEADAAAAAAARHEAAEADRLARSRLRAAEAALARARAAETELTGRASAAESRLEAAAETVAKLAGDLDETQAQAEEADRGLAALPAAGPASAALAAARDGAAQARRDEADARAAIDRLTRDAQSRRERLASIDLEACAWRQRSGGAAAQRGTLGERQQALEQEIAALAARPAEIAAASEALGAQITMAAQNARASADRLMSGETRLRDATERSRLADRALAEIRERRARLDVQAAGAKDAVAALGRDIRERIGAAPAELEALAGLGKGQIPPDAAASAERLDRLHRERAAIGPVNLMAEGEAAEVGAQVEALERERAELTEAIAKLRRGAHALDQQGRELLAAAFERVNGHFGALFTRLFGGGNAELALTDDGDPLTAGLEIMANPTGKRLQSLSLLSGGEQALTALALLFAVFLTKPAPICVLDEVDAPLDDANVDRLCGLVAEIADNTGTRFLLITHHRITMARADRLFGVTMVERGVSQLVSVDLARAVRLRQTA
ncbi:MAG TPA: chromosome segregation protein SMC [Stellaceae bacterium]|nr:chromosome segregation protein SMC [Stellaceae bacterium]